MEFQEHPQIMLQFPLNGLLVQSTGSTHGHKILEEFPNKLWVVHQSMR